MTAPDLLEVTENAMIEQLASRFIRSPFQVNRRHESDAELIYVPGVEQFLVLTADAISEEIETGLYDDPALIGWMTVMSAVSDLAAVGADPLGILLVEVIPRDVAADALAALQQSIQKACRSSGIPVLGGDTNRGENWLTAATAVGFVPRGMQLTRLGASPGEVVCATGPVGAGTAFAVARLQGRAVPFTFRPRARLGAGHLLRRFASCCIDTSDGVLAALDQLMRLNGVGFTLSDPKPALHPVARRTAEDLVLPYWTMLAGMHGEFELLFTIATEKLHELRVEARVQGWEPLPLGVVHAHPVIAVSELARTFEVDTGRLRNLFDGPLPPLRDLIGEVLKCEGRQEARYMPVLLEP